MAGTDYHPDPLTAECPACLQPPGSPCRTQTGRPARTHMPRPRLALAMEAHADPALDGWGLGPVSACLICGSGLPQRHRMVDAIAGHLSADELPEEIAEELAVSAGAVLCVQEWMQRWPGVWH